MANELPSEIQTLIENHINGFNTQNTELFLAIFGDTAIIIDGIAPYRWLIRMLRPIGLLMSRSGVRSLRFHTSIFPTRWASGTWRAPMRTLS